MFDEVHVKFKGVVKFGVVEVTAHGNLLHYLPFKFSFFPNIFAYQTGEGAEMFPEIERYGVASIKLIKYLAFSNWVENIYANRVQIIDENKLKSLISDKDVKKEMNSFDSSQLKVELLFLSTKNYVEIHLKDFAKNYEHALTVYQNDIGLYDKVSVFIYNKVYQTT